MNHAISRTPFKKMKHRKFVHIEQIAIKITFKLPKIVKKGCHRKLLVLPDVCGRACARNRMADGCRASEGPPYEHKAESLR